MSSLQHFLQHSWGLIKSAQQLQTLLWKGVEFMKIEQIVKIVSITTTVVSIGVSIASSWVSDKQMAITIDEKVKETMLEMANNKES